jgi:hypothetical protein
MLMYKRLYLLFGHMRTAAAVFIAAEHVQRGRPSAAASAAAGVLL